MKERYIVISILLFIILVLAVGQIRDFGDPTHIEMDTYFLGNAQEHTGASNVVTAVVFDYRRGHSAFYSSIWCDTYIKISRSR